MRSVYVLTFLALSVILVHAPYASASSMIANKVNIVPLSSLTIVENIEDSIWDEYAILTLLPLTVFNIDGTLYVSPIVYDSDRLPTRYLVEDWISYCSNYNGLDTLFTVGDVHLQPLPDAHMSFNFDLEDPCSLSLEVVRRVWRYSEKAILALINDSISVGDIVEKSFTGVLNSTPIEIETKTPVANKFSQPLMAYSTHPGVSIIADAGDVRSSLEVVASTKLHNIEQLFYDWIPYVGVKNDSFFILLPDVEAMLKLEMYPPSSAQIKITYFPGAIYHIMINETPSCIEAKLTWTGEDASLRAYLISPEGYVFASSMQVSDNFHMLKATGLEAGNWTLVVVETAKTTIVANYTLHVSIGSYPPQVAATLETAVNAAVLASAIHAPIIFTHENLSDEILNALKLLNAREIYLIGIDDPRVSNVYNQLTERGFTVHLFSSIRSIRNVLGTRGCTLFSYFENINDFASAAVISAYHRFTAVTFNGDYAKIYHVAKMVWGWATHASDTYHGHKELHIPKNDYEIAAVWMPTLYKKITSMLTARFGCSIKQLIISSSRYDIPGVLDRSLAGALTIGRMIGIDHVERMAFISRNILNKFLSTLHLKKIITATFTTYDHGAFIHSTDFLKELAKNNSYTFEAHTHLPSILSSFENGSCIWLYLGHGMAGSGFGLFKPDVWRGYEKGGSVDDPDVDNDGFVDSSDNREHYYYYSIYDFNASIENLHSMMFISYGCVSGAWEVPTVFAQHGSPLIIASMTVTYGGIGDKVLCDLIAYLLRGLSVGEAFKKVIAEHCRTFSGSSENFYAAWYILMGDIDLKMYPFDTLPEEPALLGEILDFEKPTIIQFTYHLFSENNCLHILATVQDNTQLRNVTLHYSFDNATWYMVEMTSLGNGTYYCVITLEQGKTIYFYVEAIDLYLNVQCTSMVKVTYQKETQPVTGKEFSFTAIILTCILVAALAAIVYIHKRR